MNRTPDDDYDPTCVDTTEITELPSAILAMLNIQANDISAEIEHEDAYSAIQDRVDDDDDDEEEEEEEEEDADESEYKSDTTSRNALGKKRTRRPKAGAADKAGESKGEDEDVEEDVEEDDDEVFVSNFLSGKSISITDLSTDQRNTLASLLGSVLGQLTDEDQDT